MSATEVTPEPEALGFYLDKDDDVWEHDATGWVRLTKAGRWTWDQVAEYAPRRLAAVEPEPEPEPEADDDTEVTPTDRVVYAHLSLIDAIRALPEGQTAETGTKVTLLSGATLTLGVQLEAPRPTGRRF